MLPPREAPAPHPAGFCFRGIDGMIPACRNFGVQVSLLESRKRKLAGVPSGLIYVHGLIWWDRYLRKMVQSAGVAIQPHA